MRPTTTHTRATARRGAALALAMLCSTLPARADDPPLWIAVVAPQLEEAVAPLVERRRAEGLRVLVIRTADHATPAELAAGDGTRLRNRVWMLADGARGPVHVLLVGAYGAADAAAAAATVVPPLRGMRGRMAGKPTDRGYEPPTGDPIPTVAVGRLPARSAEEARGMVAKLLLFEQGRSPGAWQRRLTLLVGDPGGSSALEQKFAALFVQSAVGQRLEHLPPTFVARAVVNVPGSPFTVPEDTARDTGQRFLKEGQLVALYLGHSSSWSCDFFGRSWLHKAVLPYGGGVFFTCGCYGCQADGSSENDESYGLAAVRNPSGPAAVIGAHGVSYSAMGLLAADGLQAALFAAQPGARLGDLWLGVARGLAQGPIDGATFWLYDRADGSNGTVPLDAQRLEHLEMWTLLGDPAMRLPLLPRSIELRAAVDGDTVEVTGRMPAGLAATGVHVALERRLGSTPPVGTDVNDVVLAAVDAPVREGTFTCRLSVPAAERPWGRLVVRATAAIAEAAAQGVAELPR